MSVRLKQVLAAAILFVGVTALLIGGAVFLGSLSGLAPTVDIDDAPTTDPDVEPIDRLSAEGTIDVAEAPSQTIVVDLSQNNHVTQEELQPLTGALVAAGHDVRVAKSSVEFQQSLAEADGAIVIDPGVSPPEDHLDELEAFVEDGGQLLLMGRPQVAVIQEGFIAEQPREIDTYANRFGFSFSSDHLYDLEANDGNHRNVITETSDHALMADVDEVVVSMAGHLQFADAEPLLVTNESAQRASGGAAGAYPVAAVDEDVLAVADVDFLIGERRNVLDTNDFIAALVAFFDPET